MHYFADREEAAEQLAVHVLKHRGPDTVEPAIPRGGVPIGSLLAKQLQAPLDLVMAKKIGFPGDPEYAIGAVCENETLVETNSGVSTAYIEQQRENIKQASMARYRTLTGRDRPVDIRQKKVILTDDGIATGRTMLVAVRAIRKHQPAEIIVAVPVCSPEARHRLKPEVDELISCYYPDPFIGVAKFYRHFEQVTDLAVRSRLQTTLPTINFPTPP